MKPFYFAWIRRFCTFGLLLTLGLTSVACGSSADVTTYPNQSTTEAPVSQSPRSTSQARLSDGKYPVQQITYDDATGEYTAMLLNTAPGQPSVFRTAELPMARLTDQEVQSGAESYLSVEQGQPSLRLAEDFRIEYVHNVTQEVANPQTGQPETVVVRRETGFWAPFAGALAGQAIGNLLFTPHYYFPPVYRPGLIVGYGGYGRTYGQAVQRYSTRYQAPPAEVRNRRTIRTAGRLRTPTGAVNRTNPAAGRQRDRATGSGFGSSTLRRNRSNPTYRRSAPRGFGSSRGMGRVRRR